MSRLLLLLTFFLFALITRSQTVIHVNAGSRASYGNYRDLVIAKNGHCIYKVHKVNGPVTDSAVFNITSAQVDSLTRKANELGFFNLKSRYDGGLSDGSGIFIAIADGERKHSVDIFNTEQPQIKEWLATLNRMLEPHRIRIYYSPNLRPNN